MSARSPRGIALVSVMLALAVCLMLLGAFLTTNRSYLRLFQGGKDRDKVREAISSAYEFCRYKVEDDKTWGGYFAEPLQVYRFPKLEVEELAPIPGSQGARLRGRMLESGATFEVTVQNNLNQDTVSAFGVPARSCRFLLSGQAGTGSGAASVTVRRAAFFDSTMVASEGITVKADNLIFESRDPIHNQIRSQSDMELPPLYHDDPDDGSRYLFRPGSGGNQGSKGTVWAKGEVNLRPNPYAEPDDLSLASQVTGARFVEQGRTHYEIPQLALEDIDVRGNELNITPGYYWFNNTRLEYQDAGGNWQQTDDQFMVLERWDTDSPTSLREFYFMETDLEGSVGTYGQVRIPDRGGAGVAATDGGAGKFALQDGVEVSLSAQTMEIAADREVKVGGDFGFGSFLTDPEHVATLHFKDPVLDPSAPPPPPGTPPDRGALTAGGDININGYVLGSGNLLSGRDVRLRPNEADVDAGVSDDLAIYAGRDVIIEPATGVAANNIYFKGLVYAERNFDFTARRDGQGHEQTLTIEGALVARTGNVHIRNSQTTHLIYNPDYLDDLLKQREDNRAQVELVVWQPR